MPHPVQPPHNPQTHYSTLSPLRPKPHSRTDLCSDPAPPALIQTRHRGCQLFASPTPPPALHASCHPSIYVARRAGSAFPPRLRSHRANQACLDTPSPSAPVPSFPRTPLARCRVRCPRAPLRLPTRISPRAFSWLRFPTRIYWRGRARAARRAGPSRGARRAAWMRRRILGRREGRMRRGKGARSKMTRRAACVSRSALGGTLPEAAPPSPLLGAMCQRQGNPPTLNHPHPPFPFGRRHGSS
jgi:hypothetical protein